MCQSCVDQILAILVCSCLLRVEKTHGMTFVPFYSVKKENISKNRSKVV